MLKLDNHASRRHFLHIPGPSPVPPRVLRAISYQTIDHRGPEFGAFGLKVLEGIKKIFKTEHPVVIYSASGTGSWEGALVNVVNPGDKEGCGIKVLDLEERLRKDTQHEIKAVCVVHNETSTGMTSNILAVRKAIDAAKHPALLLVDSVSGIGSADYEHDKWGVDVTVAGSQKGLMLPPGIGFNALSPKAIEASKHSKFPKAYLAWDEILESNKNGYWPTTPSTNLMYGLHEEMDKKMAEVLDTILARHQRFREACRRAVAAWGLENQCADSSAYSPVLTAALVPEGMDADLVRKHALEKFNLSLGTGLGKLKGRVFRIGHLGDCNELSLMAALSGAEMSLGAMGYKPKESGVVAAQEFLK